MEQLQSIRWPDRLSGLQCSSLLAVLLENRPLQRRGWWQLVDCWDRADPVDVAERLWSLATCHQAGPAVEPDSGFQDREDVLEVGRQKAWDFCKVYVDVWFGETAVLGALKHKHKSRGYDEADKLLLRTLMRRYGWERHLDESTSCAWMETFEAVKKAEDWSRFAWFLVAHLLHPACRESLRAWRNPVTVLESRLDRSGIDDLLAWQDLHGCSSLPEKKQHADLAKRVGKYFNSREARVRTLQKAYPADFAPLPGYRVECLSVEGDSLRGVPWRSAAERALMFSIPGWREEGKGKEEFHPLQDFCKHWLPEADEMECLDLLTNTQRPVAWKLEQVARRLDCSPTVSGVQEALAKRLLRSFPEDAGECLQKFCCRLCPTDCADAKSFKEHVAQEHAGVGLQDTPRMLIEYRKKILALVERAGPLVPGMSRQRTIAANLDERLRCPAGTSEEGRVEAACVVCARRFWAHELNKVLLFTDPAQAEGLPQLPDGVDAAVRPSQQHRLCRLLGVPRYAERWPHIALEELQKSAVEHPFLPGEYVLLHRRRMPEDARQPSPVCRDCRTSLTAQVLTLPRHALANDLWLGRALPELRSLSAGTKRLLPLVRVCMQVTVLQPVVLPHAERQKGFIGNTIFLPQASPSSVEAVLPPRAEDMAEHILFVLVGHNRGDLRSSATMQAPREEYVAAVERLRQTSKYYAEAAVDLSRWSGQEETMFEGCVLETDADSYLAKELLQRGPADAQGQESSQQEEDDAGMAEDTAESGHLISSIVGLNDTSDDENRWLRVCRDVEDLCRRKPRQYDTDAELVVRNRANNDLGVGAAQMEGANLLGREGVHERGVLRRIRQVQTVAAHGVETERQAQGQMFEVRPQKLVVPSRDTPLSMFEPGTWAMAFPTLFPWGDGVPFLKRETSMEASEVFRYLLLREELQYSGDAGVEDEEQLLPTMYDVQRRLTLMRTSKAYVKRSGFGRHCSVIASVTSEHLLKAMALRGEKADIRELLRSPDVDVPLKRALGSVLQASSNVLGTEGHRSQIRLRGHAAGWHYGPSHIFVTPNLADSRASLLLQLHLQGGSRVEAYEVDLAWDLEAPALPSLSAMRRILAADPVSQARFFDVMMTLFFEEILGTLPPLTRASFRGGLARDFEDGFAAPTHAGCFGDVAGFCGSMHPHILVVLLGHDLGNRLRSVLATAARGELVIELERWSRAVLQAASRIRYDSQQALSQQLEQEVCPLPLSENQRAACGRQYSDVPLRSTEPDGHEAATESSTPLRLTGCFASLRPHYVRRSKAAAFNAASWSGALCRDYRRLVIQNHFHKCTKSCFKKTLGGNAAKGKRGCRFGCFHVELHKETEDSGLEKVRARCLKGWPRVQRAQFMILPRENVPLEEEEAMKNENPHVLQPQRDHPFEGMSNPIAQVSMRCNVDVKYLGRGFCDADLQKLAANEEDGDGQGGDAQPPGGERKKKDKSLDARLHRVVVDMFRDMQDVQLYTGEYASKKFEVSRSLLPELFAGVQRLEAEEAQRDMPSGHDAAVAEAAPVPEAAPLPAELARLRALSLLRRLAFGVQRCVAKSNGEMAYQLLFQQEQLVSYSGYNMFFQFVPYAMFRCRAVALDAAAASAPHLKVLPLEPVEAEETDAIPVQEVAEVFDEEDLTESGIPTGGTRVVSHNQKDDYLHRGASELRTADDNVVVPVDLRLPGQNEPEKYAAFMLGLSLPFPRCPGAQHCGESWQCFHCHEIEKLEGKGFLRASFSKTWKHWKACMQVRNVNAQERLLAGLSLPFLRDLVGLREWCDVSCLYEMLLDGADPEISEEMPAQEPAGEDAEDQGILFPSASTPSPLSSTYHLMWCLGKVFKGKHGRYVDLPRIHERICWSLGIPCGFHYTQLTPLEHMSHVQLQWLERFRLHHEARQLSSSQRRAERFAYMTKEEEGEDVEECWIQHDDVGPVDIEGSDVENDLEREDAIERMDCAEHPVSREALKEVLFREKDWKRCLAGRDNRTKFALSRLKQVVEAMGGLPNVTVNVEGERPLDGALRRAWAYAEAQDMFDRQSQYLENLSGGLLRQIDSIFVESVPDDAEEEFAPTGLEAMTATDPFLMDLNAQNLRPRDYALKLECTLNAQQIRAVAPIVCTIDEMWEKRAEASTCFANGQPSERCNSLWLGAGGSGKTWAYTKVLRPLFQRFFGFGRYTAGAPTHAAARLLGAEARTLHKLASISPNSALHRGAIRGQRNKNDALEQQILASLACIVDELSMSAADVYHALGLRFSVKRCEDWALDLSRYLQEWFGKMPIGLQLGDFLQLRPAAQASLCEWVEVPSAVEPAPLTELQEAEAPEQASNAAELGRLLFKNSMCTSLELGTAMTDALWAQLQSRVYEVQQLQDLQTAPSRRAFLRAYWGALAWEQVARLQQLRAVLEAEDAGERLYFVQAIDKPTGDATLSSAQVSAALQCLNMTKTGYLIGMCPLFLGMEVRISCILPEPLLTRELPCIVRRIELHPKEPPTPPGAACVVLQYQPLGVLVEVADSDYGQFQVPGDDVPKGHFYVRPVFNKQSAWVFEVAPKQKLRLVRKQVPLAPQRVLTHFGLQGITARSGLVAFLNQPPWMKDGDYGLALYVMLSRATKLSDLWLIGVPERPYFEGFLHERNKTLVDRMSLFERLSVQSEQAAEKYIQKLLWRGNAYVNRTLGVSGTGQAKRRRLTGKTAVA
ncbi:Transketolase [Durusdinium trenchii]|uniref:Transketolase n=1 Tax=Durusdinium trenchii TaxID=1381693 RepID=A0ABP0PLS7_9DINO